MAKIFFLFIIALIVSCVDSTLPNSPLLESSLSSSSTLPNSSSSQIISESSSSFSSSSSLVIANSSSLFSSSSTLVPSSSSSSQSTPSSSSFSPGTLHISYLPIDNNGDHSPKNVYAVWITNSLGALVQTIEEKGLREYKYLTQWRKVYTKTPVKGVDGVAGATATSFTPFQGTWTPAAIGSYTLHIEFATENASGPHVAIPLTITNSAFRDSLHYTNYNKVILEYTP